MTKEKKLLFRLQPDTRCQAAQEHESGVSSKKALYFRKNTTLISFICFFLSLLTFFYTVPFNQIPVHNVGALFMPGILNLLYNKPDSLKCH